MTLKIAPALEPGEWAKHRAHGISIDKPLGEVHLVVQDPDGEVVSVSGADELFALMALSLDALNQTLPETDPRRISHQTARLLRMAAVAEQRRTDISEQSQLSNARLLENLADVIQALVPPPAAE